MKPCLSCPTLNTDESKFCQKCGKPLDSASFPDANATIRWTGEMPSTPRKELRRSVAMEDLFVAKNRIVVGRAADCDVCLPHPTISRYHALLERVPEGVQLRDLGSVNGVSLGGERLVDCRLLADGDRIGVGPFLFTLKNGVIYTLDSSRSLRLEARNLEKVVRTADGTPRQLLGGINLAIEPGEFISLLGPSGSGKSTLMDCLNGRRRATGGRVLANGEDFYRHFDSFRQSLGYVPQRDIVHTQLTVYRALYYTAQLRLPTDTDPAELHGRIEEVLQEMELGPHRDTLVANLSGGQIKRVSLGAELLARPCLLYIDEATSGLDAGTEARMMRLFRRLADEGKSIVCITHNVDNVDRCHLALILLRGRLIYFGPPAEAPGYFGVDRLGEIYDKLTEKDLETWENQFAASDLHQEFVAKRLATPFDQKTPPPAAPLPKLPSSGLLGALARSSAVVALSRQPEMAQRFKILTNRYSRLREYLTPLQELWHQFRVLTVRYAELTLSDRRSLRLFWLQAPIVAFFILLGFTNKPYDERVRVMPARNLTEEERTIAEAIEERAGEFGAPGREVAREIDKVLRLDALVNPRFTYMLLYLLAITVLWFGCNNAAKEIVKEEAVYGRERAVNLGILPYLASKFVVLSLLSAAQVALLLFVVFGVLTILHVTLGHAMPYADYVLDYPRQFGVLVLLAMTGVALGLVLSACVASPDRANALLPYVLIPQIILGGGMLPIHGEPLHTLALTFSPVYWAFRACRRGATTLPADLPIRMDYNDSVALACVALTLQLVVLLFATAWFLKRKDA